MRKKKVAVIGGGAAGIAAALEAARHGVQVTIFEKNDRVGKKILATGNGKCNLSNRLMGPECFHTTDREKLAYCLQQFGVEETVGFFEELGLMIKDKNGYLYPVSEQAAVVLDVLRSGMVQRGIRLRTECMVTAIRKKENEDKSFFFEVVCGKEKEAFDKVIIACGGKAAPKTGSDGYGYELAKSFGHRIVPVVPSLVQLKCSDSFCKALAGIRSDACIHIFEDGQCLCQEMGEVQLTDYGISGIPVFQLSALVNRRLSDKNHGKLTAVIDFMPGLDREAFDGMKKNRVERLISPGKGKRTEHGEMTVEAFFTGMLNKKLMTLFVKLAGLKPELPIESVTKEQLDKVFRYCKGLEYHIVGHNGFENAQVCSGGVDMREVTAHLESKKQPGLYFAGEVLDVDGRCGGYNLQWAWTSGVIAARGSMKNP